MITDSAMHPTVNRQGTPLRLRWRRTLATCVCLFFAVANAAAQDHSLDLAPPEQTELRTRARKLPLVDLPEMYYFELPAALERLTGLHVTRLPQPGFTTATDDPDESLRLNPIHLRDVTLGTLLDLIALRGDMPVRTSISPAGDTIYLQLESRYDESFDEACFELRDLLEHLLPDALRMTGAIDPTDDPTQKTRELLEELLVTTTGDFDWPMYGGSGEIGFAGSTLELCARPTTLREVRDVLRQLDAALRDPSPSPPFDPPPPIVCDDAPASRAVWELLAEPRDWPAIEGVPWASALREIADQIGINLMIDTVDIGYMVPSTNQISLRAMRGTPAWSRITAILALFRERVPCALEIRGGVLCVAPTDILDHDRSARVYYVGELLDMRLWRRQQLNCGAECDPDQALHAYEAVLTSSVKPEAWFGSAGRPTIARLHDHFVVRAPATVHREFAETLWKLRCTQECPDVGKVFDGIAHDPDRPENRRVHDHLDRTVRDLRLENLAPSKIIDQLATKFDLNLAYAMPQRTIDAKLATTSLVVDQTESLRSVLERLLDAASPPDEELALSVSGGIVWIESSRRSESLYMRAYFVGDLIAPLEHFDGWTRAFRHLQRVGALCDTRWLNDIENGTLVQNWRERHQVFIAPPDSPLGGCLWMCEPADEEWVARYLSSPMIRLAEWLEEELSAASGRANSDSSRIVTLGTELLVRESPENHRRIKRYLEELRRGLVLPPCQP